MPLCIWFLSLTIMFLRSIHVVACISTSFPFMAESSEWIYTFHLPIHQLINIVFVSTFWPLWIMMLWTFVYDFLCGYIVSFLFRIYLGIELLGHMVTQLFKELLNCFKVAASLHNVLLVGFTITYCTIVLL